MKKTFKIPALLVLIFSQTIYSQGPWTKEKGKGYAQIGYSGISYNKVFYDGQTLDLASSRSDVTTQIYSEYGISNKFEAQLILPYKFLSRDATSFGGADNLSGFGNVTIGFKYKLSDKDWKISTGIQYSANSITKNDLKGFRTGFDANTIFPYLTLGSSTGKYYYFANIGYGYMDNNYSDYVKIGAEFGYEAFPKGHLILGFQSRNVVSKESFFENDYLNYVASANYLDRQTYSAIGLKLNYEFIKDKFGANIGTDLAFALNNAPAAPALNINLYSKF
jgi:hypothetical protein